MSLTELRQQELRVKALKDALPFELHETLEDALAWQREEGRIDGKACC